MGHMGGTLCSNRASGWASSTREALDECGLEGGEDESEKEGVEKMERGFEIRDIESAGLAWEGRWSGGRSEEESSGLELSRSEMSGRARVDEVVLERVVLCDEELLGC